MQIPINFFSLWPPHLVLTYGLMDLWTDGPAGHMELALRFDWARLSDMQITGSSQLASSFALNWCLTGHARLTLKDIDCDVKAGAFGDGHSQLKGTCVQINW